MPRLTRFLAAAGCIAYPLLSHAAAVRGEAYWAAAGVALLGWGIASVGLGALASAVLGLIILAAALALAVLAPAVILYAPPLVLNLALCALFGGTLIAGREAMVSRFARIERGELPPELTRYTRALTGTWAAFFALMACISLGLALWASTLAWSLFTNLGNYLLVGVFFAVEYHYRRMKYPQYAHASLGEFMRRLHTYRPLSGPTNESKA